MGLFIGMDGAEGAVCVVAVRPSLGREGIDPVAGGEGAAPGVPETAIFACPERYT